MDTKELQSIFSSITGYVDNLRTYIQKLQPDLYIQVSRLAGEIRDLIGRVDAAAPTTTATAFQWLHTVQSVFNNVQKLFALMDWRPDYHTGQISKTGATHFASQWQDITRTYRIYVRDSAVRVASAVTELAPLASTLSPTELQRLFHQYPYAVDLYINIMTARIDALYRNGRRDEVAAIVAIIESDKSHALAEPHFVSPYLTLGLHPRHALCTLAEIATRAGVEAKTLEDLARALAARATGLFVVYRELPQNQTSLRPPQTNPVRGLIPTDTQSLIQTIPGGRWNWKIKIYGREHPSFLCVESLGPELWRITTPWSEDGPLITPAGRLAKILGKNLGRPQAYYTEMDRTLAAAYNPHVRAVGHRTAPSTSPDALGLNRSRVVHAMLRAYSESKSEERLEDPAVWIAWRTAMINDVADETQVDTFLHLLTVLERQFRKDLVSAFKRDRPTDQAAWVEANIGAIFGALLGRNHDIFGILAQKRIVCDEMRRVAP